MADAVFSYELEDQAPDAADDAAAALERLRDKLAEDTAALGEMNKALRALKGSAHVNTTGFKALQDRVASQKATIASAHAQYLNLGGNFRKLKKPTEDAKGGFGKLAEVAGRMPGPLGGVVGRLGAIKGLLVGGGIAAGALAIVAALAVLVVGLGLATAALLKYGIAAADARRNELLQLEGLTKVRNWYGLAADKAGFLQDQIDRVSGSVSLGREQINGLASSLYRANLRGNNLSLALEGVAIAEAAAGQGDFYKNMILGGARAQGGIKRVVDDIKARFGGVARAQMLSLDVQTRKLHENFARLFSGLKLEGFLEGLKSIGDLFSQNNETGRALKTLLETLFNPILDAIETVAPAARVFFHGMVIGAQLLTIGVLRLRSWLKRTFGDSEILSGFNLTKAAFYTGIGVVALLAAGVLILAAAFATLAAAVALPFVLVLALLNTLKKAQSLGAEFSTSFRSVGGAIVDGLVDGIKNGAIRLVQAVKGLATDAKNAFKNAIESRSPSKLFARLSFAMPQGGAVGVRQGTPLLVRATRAMVRQTRIAAEGLTGGAETSFEPGRVAPAPSALARPPRATSSSRSVTVTIGELSVHAADGKPESIAEAVKAAVERLFEGAAIHMGAETEPV